MRDAGGGVIVNVSSYAADVGGAGIEAPYAITKGGLNVLTRSCAHEGGPVRHPRRHRLATGIVRARSSSTTTPRSSSGPATRARSGTFADRRQVAEAIAFLASDRARHITGEILNIAAGAYMRN